MKVSKTAAAKRTKQKTERSEITDFKLTFRLPLHILFGDVIALIEQLLALCESYSRRHPENVRVDRYRVAAETHAVNDVTSIVFDFRGYDTMGEAFILITAVAGAVVILYTAKKKEETGNEQK